MLNEQKEFLQNRTNAKKLDLSTEKFKGKGYTEDEFHVKEKGMKIHLKKI